MSQLTQLVFDVDASTASEKEIAENVNSMSSPAVKLNYRSDMLNFRSNCRVVLSNTANAEMLTASKYAMFGTLMYFRNSTLTLSFGGLIGEFTLDEQQNARLCEECSGKWYCYVV